jgi:hypothetical protein
MEMPSNQDFDYSMPGWNKRRRKRRDGGKEKETHRFS